MREQEIMALDELEQRLNNLPESVAGKSTAEVVSHLRDYLAALRKRESDSLLFATLIIPEDNDEAWAVDPSLIAMLAGDTVRDPASGEERPMTGNDAAIQAIAAATADGDGEMVFVRTRDIDLTLLSLCCEEYSWDGSATVERPSGVVEYPNEFGQIDLYTYSDGTFDTLIIAGGNFRGQLQIHTPGPRQTLEGTSGLYRLGETGAIALREGRYLIDHGFLAKYFFPTEEVLPYINIGCRPLQAAFNWVPALPSWFPGVDESGKLPWQVELALSIVFEPADWYFTARDLKEGDCEMVLAVLGIGLIFPVIPGSVGKFKHLMSDIDFSEFAERYGLRATREFITEITDEAIPHVQKRIDGIVADLNAARVLASSFKQSFEELAERGWRVLTDLIVTKLRAISLMIQNINVAKVGYERAVQVKRLAMETRLQIYIAGAWGDDVAESLYRKMAFLDLTDRLKRTRPDLFPADFDWSTIGDLAPQNPQTLELIEAIESMQREVAADWPNLDWYQVKLSSPKPKDLDVYIPLDQWNSCSDEVQREVKDALAEIFGVSKIDFYQEIPPRLGGPDPRYNIPPGSILFNPDGTITHDRLGDLDIE